MKRSETSWISNKQRLRFLLLLCLLVFADLCLYGCLSANKNLQPLTPHSDSAESNRRLLQTLAGHSNTVHSVAFSPDGKLLASQDGTIKLWEVVSGRLLQTAAESVSSIAFSPDGKLLASGNRGGTVTLWKISSNLLEISGGRLLPTLQGHRFAVNSVAFSRDGKLLANGNFDGTIIIREVTSGRILRAFGHFGTVIGSKTPVHWCVYSVAFSPDGKLLASGSCDSTVKLWEVSTGTLLQTLTGHTDNVYSVVFSPDGKLLASGSRHLESGVNDSTIKMWSVLSGNVLQKTLEHSPCVNSVAFSPDGKLLVSGGSNATIRLWEVSTGTLLQTLTGHTDSVLSVAFSPDGKLLASGSHDKTVRLWTVNP